MPSTIRVPFNSPAFESYVHEGWRQIYLDGLWATLRLDQDGQRRRDSARPDLEGASERRETGTKERAA